MDENKPSRITSRADKVGKKRKVNRIYNILLGIVIIAIIVVLVAIFSGNDEENQAAPAEEKSAQQEEKTNNNETVSDRETDSSDTDETDNEEQEEDRNTEESTETDSLENATIVDSSSNDSNVETTFENENWQPVGTTQTGEHVTNFTKDSTDWNEMEKALAYGAGLDENNMILYWLGNGGAENKATGTVSPKDKSVTYRVYIEWVDGGGWKPYKVEQLKTNDR